MISIKAKSLNYYRKPNSLRLFIFSDPQDTYLTKLKKDIAKLLSVLIEIRCIIVDWQEFNKLYFIHPGITQYTVQMFCGLWTIGSINKPDEIELTKFIDDCQKTVLRDDWIFFIQEKGKKCPLIGNLLFYKRKIKPETKAKKKHFSHRKDKNRIIQLKNPPNTSNIKPKYETNNILNVQNDKLHKRIVNSNSITRVESPKLPESSHVNLSDLVEINESRKSQIRTSVNMAKNVQFKNCPSIKNVSSKHNLQYSKRIRQNNKINLVQNIRKVESPRETLQRRSQVKITPQNSQIILPIFSSTAESHPPLGTSSISNLAQNDHISTQKFDFSTPNNNDPLHPKITHKKLPCNSPKFKNKIEKLQDTLFDQYEPFDLSTNRPR